MKLNWEIYSREMKVRKMLNLHRKGIQLDLYGFKGNSMVYLNHCIADSFELHNAKQSIFYGSPARTCENINFQMSYFHQKRSALKIFGLYNTLTSV